MDIIMSGEIFLKIKPDLESLGDVFRKMIKKENYVDLSEYDEEDDFKEKDEKYYEDLERLHNLVEKKLPTWYGCDNFWMSVAYKEGILMVKHNYLKAEAKKLFRNKEHVEQKFISLGDFLKDAEYVGRYFRRTEPIENCTQEDMSYMSKDCDYLALFKTKDAMIISRIFAGEPQYKVVDKRYLEDGKYEFFGPYNEEFNDKAALYQDIYKQLHKNKTR